VRRLVAVVLAQALVASSAVGSSLHVHEYLGHDHPDHHHGPAAHDHEHSTFVELDHHSAALEDHELAVRAESCDPGRHAVSVSMACASVTQVHVDLAEQLGPRTVVPSVPIRSAIPITDVRVHGPPFDARIPSRAPPAIPHA
jgi:hypothetical protein